MIFHEQLPFIKEFVEKLDQGIQEFKPDYKLSKAQRWWLGYCLIGIVLSTTVC